MSRTRDFTDYITGNDSETTNGEHFQQFLASFRQTFGQEESNSFIGDDSTSSTNQKENAVLETTEESNKENRISERNQTSGSRLLSIDFSTITTTSDANTDNNTNRGRDVKRGRSRSPESVVDGGRRFLSLDGQFTSTPNSIENIDWSDTELDKFVKHFDQYQPRELLLDNNEQPRTERTTTYNRLRDRATNELSKNGLIQKIKENFTKNRLVHDIVDLRTDSTHALVVSELEKLTSINSNSFFIAVYHNKPNFEHLHIIHNCNFSNTCRCSFMQTFPTKRRTDKSTKLTYQLQNDYIDNLVEYLLQNGYCVVKILFGSETWKISSENHCKYMKNI